MLSLFLYSLMRCVIMVDQGLPEEVFTDKIGIATLVTRTFLKYTYNHLY